MREQVCYEYVSRSGSALVVARYPPYHVRRRQRRAPRSRVVCREGGRRHVMLREEDRLKSRLRSVIRCYVHELAREYRARCCVIRYTR